MTIYDDVLNGKYEPKSPRPEVALMRENRDEWKRMRTAYLEEKRRLRDDFKRDALECHGLTDHEKGEAVFELAWEYGHAEGMTSVLDYIEDLVELVK